MDTQEKIKRLEELSAQLAEADHMLTAEVDQIVAPLRSALDEARDKHSPHINDLQREIDAITDAIRQDVIAGGESVRGAKVTAVYAKGRISWDSKLLDGYAAAHPEIERFRKVGEPSVSFRWAKDG